MRKKLVLTLAGFAGALGAIAPESATAAVQELAEVCQSQAVSADELVLIDQDQRTTMRYITPQVRMAARALGFGGVAQYAVLYGARANLRLTNRQPIFVLAIPNNVQPQGLFTLARLEPRSNGSREVLIGGGFMSYSTGVAPDRVVPLQFDVASSQDGAPEGTTLYQLSSAQQLSPGEYAVIVGSSQQAPPLGGTTLLARYYDFGVD